MRMYRCFSEPTLQASFCIFWRLVSGILENESVVMVRTEHSQRHYPQGLEFWYNLVYTSGFSWHQSVMKFGLRSGLCQVSNCNNKKQTGKQQITITTKRKTKKPLKNNKSKTSNAKWEEYWTSKHMWARVRSQQLLQDRGAFTHLEACAFMRE